MGLSSSKEEPVIQASSAYAYRLSSPPPRPQPPFAYGVNLNRPTTSTTNSTVTSTQFPRSTSAYSSSSGLGTSRSTTSPTYQTLNQLEDPWKTDKKYEHILRTINQYGEWPDFTRKLKAALDQSYHVRYCVREHAKTGMANLLETLELIDKYLQFILPKKLQQIGGTTHRSPGGSVRTLTDWMDIEVAGTTMIAEKMNEDLLIYGLPLFLLQNNSVRSIWFWKDTAKTQCVFMSKVADLSREQKNQVVDIWNKAKAERNARQRNQGRDARQNWATSAQNSFHQESITPLRGRRAAPSPPTAPAPTIQTPLSSQGLEDLSCPICYEDYNTTNFRPMNLVPCGHSLCGVCIVQVNQCPTCRKAITSSTIAFALLGVIEKRFAESSELAALRAHREAQEQELKELKEKLEAAKKQPPPPPPPVKTEKDSPQKVEAEDQPKTEPEDHKIFLDRLPNRFTAQGVIDLFFEGGAELMQRNGRPDLSLRPAGSWQTCVANLTSKEAAEKVISTWKGILMDNGEKLFIRKFLPANQRQQSKGKGKNLGCTSIKLNEPAKPTDLVQQNKSTPTSSTPTPNQDLSKCRIRITKIPLEIKETNFIQLFDKKSLDNLFCFIQRDNDKPMINLTPATNDTNSNGTCIITMNSKEAAIMIQRKFGNKPFPNTNCKMGIAYWPR